MTRATFPSQKLDTPLCCRQKCLCSSSSSHLCFVSVKVQCFLQVTCVSCLMEGLPKPLLSTKQFLSDLSLGSWRSVAYLASPSSSLLLLCRWLNLHDSPSLYFLMQLMFIYSMISWNSSFLWHLHTLLTFSILSSFDQNPLLLSQSNDDACFVCTALFEITLFFTDDRMHVVNNKMFSSTSGALSQEEKETCNETRCEKKWVKVYKLVTSAKRVRYTQVLTTLCRTRTTRWSKHENVHWLSCWIHWSEALGRV